MVGNIYLAKIYFTDLSEYKIRPVLVIKELNEDCICLQLTSSNIVIKLYLLAHSIRELASKNVTLPMAKRQFGNIILSFKTASLVCIPTEDEMGTSEKSSLPKSNNP